MSIYIYIYVCKWSRESAFCHRSLVSPRERDSSYFRSDRRQGRLVFLKSTPVRMRMWTQTGGEEPPRLVRSPERIHCLSGARIDRRQVYPPRNPFYSLSKSVSCRKNDPTESASTFCKDSTVLSSLLLIRSYHYGYQYWLLTQSNRP